MTTPRPAALVVLAVLAGTLVAGLLGLLTSGVQATVAPDRVPVALALPDDAPGPLRQVAERVTEQGGDQVAWHLVTPERAAALLADRDVYGVLAFELTPDGLAPTVTVSGAVNPSGTQVAQQLLTTAGQAASAAAAERLPGATARPATVITEHPASAAARAVPLAASQLLWIGCLVGSVLLVGLTHRTGRRFGVGVRIGTTLAVPVGVVGGLLALMALWDSGLRMDARLVGFLLLVALAFAAVQGAVLRLLGLAGMAVLVPLFLIAPAVAGQVPELLHPAYRTLLWSWTPFRFSTEGVRSLLLMDHVPPDVRTAIWVLAGLAVAGLAVLLWPSRRGAVPAADGMPERAPGA
ncbi:MAG TPA: ABC transporter permease [Pseudonocardiaceae bacterium]